MSTKARGNLKNSFLLSDYQAGCFNPSIFREESSRVSVLNWNLGVVPLFIVL